MTAAAIVDRCAVCNAPTVRVARYDAYACMVCRRWIEAACDEDTCDLCCGRPAEPIVEPPPSVTAIS